MFVNCYTNSFVPYASEKSWFAKMLFQLGNYISEQDLRCHSLSFLYVYMNSIYHFRYWRIHVKEIVNEIQKQGMLLSLDECRSFHQGELCTNHSSPQTCMLFNILPWNVHNLKTCIGSIYCLQKMKVLLVSNIIQEIWKSRSSLTMQSVEDCNDVYQLIWSSINAN